ncbi:MAG: aldo/keto reductase family protein [Candidatus Hodarchaeales archaeon]|jgi:diketogulonate reductase-like aldo/keto reductase
MKIINSDIMYGTAWKEDKTESLTLQALQAGFNAIDTANQRKHYYEEGVGKAITAFLVLTNTKREDLLIQTKFTYKEGQDHRLPYNPKAEQGTQVQQSLQSSLDHLKTDYIDSYVLHGPSTRFGLSKRDWETWRAMEVLVEECVVLQLGISNCTAEQLNLLLEHVEIKPSYVQNRCFARFGWDKAVRDICKRNSIVYQGFSLLTTNREVLAHPKVIAISKNLKKTVPQIIFSFARQVGMLPLTGTSNKIHMDQDLESVNIQITKEQMNLIENISMNY